jgi:hypothetical protein
VYPLNQSFADAVPAGAAASSVPLEAGSQQATAQVTLTYALEPASLHTR